MSGSAARRALRHRLRGPEAPVVLDPRAGKPRAHSVAEAPVGTIRSRRAKSGAMVAHIKVRMDGTQTQRWRPFARWWWERNRGPVPAGKCVIHLDGDSSNDAPENLAIGTTDDALFICHQTPGRNTSALRVERCQESNRIRSRVRRLRGALRHGWYVVDVEWRRIWNTGDHTRWDALARLVDVPQDARTANGAGVIAASLGWAGISSAEAALLAVLVEAGRPTGSRDAYVAADRIFGWYGRAPMKAAAWSSAASRLRRRGFTRRTSQGSRGASLEITAAARTARGRTTRLLAVHADDLGNYAGFAWVSERGQEYQRENGAAGVRRLAEEMAGV